MTQQTPGELIPYIVTLDPTIVDTVASAVWSVEPLGPTLGTPTNAGTSSVVNISLVTVGVTYTVSALLTGVSGAVYSGAIQIQGVANRLPTGCGCS